MLYTCGYLWDLSFPNHAATTRWGGVRRSKRKPTSVPNERIATFLAERLAAGLWHPGDPAKDQKPKLIPLPGLAASGLPPDMAEHFAKEAGLPSADVSRLVAEAIVNVIEVDAAHELVPRAELQRLRSDAATFAADPPTGQMVTLTCRCSREPLVEVALGRPTVQTSGPMLRKRIDEVCKCQLT